jgi:hypothetical protein
MNDTKKTPKNADNFICNICDFKCFKPSDWNRHITTAKHINGEKRYKNETNDTKKTPQETTVSYSCECGRIYRFRSGLWRHKQTCNVTEPAEYIEINSQTQLTPELIIKLIEQNKELQQTLIEQNKELQQTLAEQNKTIIDLSQRTGTYNNNSNNKTFNLQVFLNETCKDAINLSDFINQIQISLSDLETTGQIGYAEGISKVFIKNLNDINYTDRPIHCSDLKRETLYIKDNNQWSKDDENKTGLTNAIKQVASKNIKKISDWQKLHPQYSDPESKQNDKYMQIVLNSMSGSTKEESEKNYEKIVKNVVKEIVINKNAIL